MWSKGGQWANQSTALARHVYEQVTNQEIVLIEILILLIAYLRRVFVLFNLVIRVFHAQCVIIREISILLLLTIGMRIYGI